MDPILAVQVRRLWPVVLAALVGAVFTLVHAAVFVPQAARYRTAIAHANALGLMVDPAHPAQKQMLPVKVFNVVMTNSMPAAEADARSQSGTLGAETAQELSNLANGRGLEIMVAEPGVMSQQPGSIEVRAHLHLRGTYGAFLAFVDDLAHSDRLWALERFTIVPSANGHDDFDVYVASGMLKRTGGGS